MPYIPREQRNHVSARGPKTPGELNFFLTTVIFDYLQSLPMRYTDFNEVIGVLECMKLELYRRMVAPYENEKMRQYGDVYVDGHGK